MKKFLIILIVSLFIGCTNNEEIIKESTTNFNVSLDEARLVAHNAFSFLNPGNNSNKKVLKRNVVSSTTASFNGQPSFHVFNYAEGGFVIVSADKRSIPLLAYSDESEYVFNGKDKPLGLIFWENTTKEHIQILQKETTASSSVLSQWDDVSCPDNPAERVACDDGGTSTIFIKGPFLQTTWDQLCGFNNYTPSINESWALPQCYHMPAGCVATAMGQVMKYWEYPNTYNWNSMPSYSGSPEASRLFKDIGDGVHMDYKPRASAAKTSNIGGTFVGIFGYSQADYKQHYNDDYSAIVGNLDLSRPVILGGCDDRDQTQCHAWVCDGYQKIYNGGWGSLSFHMNWGWPYGVANGWFVFDNWPITVDGTTYNFRYYQQMVYNIHP